MRVHILIALVLLCATIWAKVTIPSLHMLSRSSSLQRFDYIAIDSGPTEQRPALETLLELRGGKTSTFPSIIRRTLHSAKRLIGSILPRFIRKRMGYVSRKGRSNSGRVKPPAKASKLRTKPSAGGGNRLEKV